MKKEDLRIVFMGTPEFAVESLRSLVGGGYNVVGAVTTPDKPVGRHGSSLQASAVKQYAVTQGLPILQPEKLKDETFLNELRSLQADLQIVVAYRMLPEVVWNMPRFGTFNLHASLLPQYRGAAPINRAVINGEKETGATTFFIARDIDTGRIILQEKLPIAETDDAGTIHDALMIKGAGLVVRTVDLLLANDGVIETVPQEKLYADAEELRPAPKIFKETCRIDWSMSVGQIYDFIRGLAPYPAAWTEIINPAGERVSMKIFASEKLYENHRLKAATIRTDGKNDMDIAVVDGFVRIKTLQAAGKKSMPVKDFLNGTKIDGDWKVE